MKERIAFFALFEKSERAICSFALFLEERKSDSLFGALFEKSQRAKSERAKERLPNPDIESVLSVAYMECGGITIQVSKRIFYIGIQAYREGRGHACLMRVLNLNI